MTDSATPICALIRRLLSRGLSPASALDEAEPMEAALARSATGGVLLSTRREKWRLKKARQRARKRGGGGDCPPGDKSVALVLKEDSTNTEVEKKKVSKTRKKTRAVSPGGQDDGWPTDYATQLWDAFPKHRRYDKPQVLKLLAKLRVDKVVAWVDLIEGVRRYAATMPGEFAKAPLPWLRGHRWEQNNAGEPNGKATSNGRRERVDPIAAAAARRFGGGGRNGAAPGPADPVSPSDRMGDERSRTQGSGHPAFDLDLRAGPDGVFRR